MSRAEISAGSFVYGNDLSHYRRLRIELVIGPNTPHAMFYGLCEINATTDFSIAAATRGSVRLLNAGTMSAYPPEVTAATVEIPPASQDRARPNRRWRCRKKRRRIYFSKTTNMAYGQFGKTKLLVKGDAPARSRSHTGVGH